MGLEGVENSPESKTIDRRDSVKSITDGNVKLRAGGSRKERNKKNRFHLALILRHISLHFDISEPSEIGIYLYNLTVAGLQASA